MIRISLPCALIEIIEITNRQTALNDWRGQFVEIALERTLKFCS